MLSHWMKFRMVAFDSTDIVEAMNAMFILCPHDVELFEMLGERAIDRIDHLNALNLIGVVRVFSKLENYGMLEQLVPRLQTLLMDYDVSELLEMLMALAHGGS